MIFLLISMTDQEILESNIIAELGIESLPDDKKMKIIDDAAHLVQKRAMLRILEQFSDDQKKELNDLIEKEGPESEKVASFMQTHVTGIEDILKAELIVVKRELIDKVKELDT